MPKVHICRATVYVITEHSPLDEKQMSFPFERSHNWILDLISGWIISNEGRSLRYIYVERLFMSLLNTVRWMRSKCLSHSRDLTTGP